MEISDIVTVVSGAGALLSACATFLTVREIAKQRRATYHPELVIETARFSAMKSEVEASNLPSNWRDERRSVSGDVVVSNFLGLPIRNIGLGAAKNVRVTWYMDVENEVSEINSIAQKLQIPIALNYTDGILSFNSERYGNFSSIWKNQINNIIDYILPLSHESETRYITIPDAFQRLLAIIIKMKFSEDNSTINTENLANLSAEIEFEDISDKSYKIMIDTSISLILIASAGEYFQATLRSVRS